MSNLSNAVIALTGSGSGLGLGLAKYFRDCGAKLALFDISHDKVAALKSTFGSDVLAMQGDIRDRDALIAFRDATIEQFGGVDSLVGAQGIFDGNRPISELPLEKVTAAFEEVMSINVLGYILSAIVFREALAKRNGSIVMTASSNAAYCADGGGLLYTASKHAVLGVVRQLAFEFSPDVRVNAVSPCGIGDSDMRGPGALGLENESQKDIPRDDFMAMISKVTLLGHLPAGAEYGPAYALLADPKQRVMTGEIIMADQGLANRAIISAG